MGIEFIRDYKENNSFRQTIMEMSMKQQPYNKITHNLKAFRKQLKVYNNKRGIWPSVLKVMAIF